MRFSLKEGLRSLSGRGQRGLRLLGRGRSDDGDDDNNDDDDNHQRRGGAGAYHHRSSSIQSAPPDLIIRVGEEGVVYHYFRVMMAHHSHYIDRRMVEDPTLTELSFPDIQPGVWELMLRHLLRPSNRITVTSVYLVFPFYAKYEFREGLRLCDNRIVEEMERTDTDDGISLFFDASSSSSSNHPSAVVSGLNRRALSNFVDSKLKLLLDFCDILPQTREAGIVLLEAILHDPLYRLFLSLERFKSLLPTMIFKEDRLLEPIQRVLEEVGITTSELHLASETQDNIHTIYQLLLLQYKVKYAQHQGFLFPDEDDGAFDQPVEQYPYEEEDRRIRTRVDPPPWQTPQPQPDTPQEAQAQPFPCYMFHPQYGFMLANGTSTPAFTPMAIPPMMSQVSTASSAVFPSPLPGFPIAPVSNPGEAVANEPSTNASRTSPTLLQSTTTTVFESKGEDLSNQVNVDDIVHNKAMMHTPLNNRIEEDNDGDGRDIDEYTKTDDEGDEDFVNPTNSSSVTEYASDDLLLLATLPPTPDDLAEQEIIQQQLREHLRQHEESEEEEEEEEQRKKGNDSYSVPDEPSQEDDATSNNNGGMWGSRRNLLLSGGGTNKGNSRGRGRGLFRSSSSSTKRSNTGNTSVEDHDGGSEPDSTSSNDDGRQRAGPTRPLHYFFSQKQDKQQQQQPLRDDASLQVETFVIDDEEEVEDESNNGVKNDEDQDNEETHDNVELNIDTATSKNSTFSPRALFTRKTSGTNNRGGMTRGLGGGGGTTSYIPNNIWEVPEHDL